MRAVSFGGFAGNSASNERDPLDSDGRCSPVCSPVRLGCRAQRLIQPVDRLAVQDAELMRVDDQRERSDRNRKGQRVVRDATNALLARHNKLPFRESDDRIRRLNLCVGRPA